MDPSVTQSSPREADRRSSGRFRDSLRFNQMMGVLIILSAIGAIVWLTVAARTACSANDLTFVAYVPGVVELRTDTRIEYYEQCVGRVGTVEPGVIALQLDVERRGSLGDRETVTVSPRDPERTIEGGALTIRYESPGEVELSAAGQGDRSLIDQEDGFWTVEGPAVAIEGMDPDNVVRSGQRMQFGRIDLQWSELSRFTRVTGTIDARAFERVAGNAGIVSSLASWEAALGTGTSVSVGSRIGIGTSGPAQVRLNPSYKSGSLVAGRGGIREFSPGPGTDVLAFLTEAVDYLSSSAKTDAPPLNRYERMVDDLNGSLFEMRTAVASARKLADTLGSVADGGADQLAGRLLLGQRQLGVIESALTNIDSVLTTVEASVNADPEQPALLGLLLDDEQSESLDRTIVNVRGLSEELRNGDTPVFTRIAGEYNGSRFDSIVARTDRLSVRANEMLDGLEESGGSAAKGAKIYGIVTALAQTLATIAVIGIWR